MRRLGIAADHGGYELKQVVLRELASEGEWVDFGAAEFDPGDDFPDFVVPLARAVAAGELERGVVICASGVGACIAANKVEGVRAALVTEVFSAHQGVEDDNMNVMCLGARVVGWALAVDLIKAFLGARYKAEERFERRLGKVQAVEEEGRGRRPLPQGSATAGRG
ncbi:MAG: RpiB/LacA/LacB family sugar-phosphate isomerase [Armatimonadia bacterium]